MSPRTTDWGWPSGDSVRRSTADRGTSWSSPPRSDACCDRGPTRRETGTTRGSTSPPTTSASATYTRDGVLRSLEASLQRLGLDRVDILFVHDPDDYYEAALDEVFPTLEELRGQGVIRSYGAGMNQSAMLARFVERTDLDIVMLAGRYTLLEQGALADLLPLCLARDVSVVAAGVFNSGILAKDRPDPSAHYNYETVDPDVLSRALQIADVCARHDVPLPAAAMAFVSAHPAVRTLCLGGW